MVLCLAIDNDGNTICDVKTVFVLLTLINGSGMLSGTNETQSLLAIIV